MPQIPAGWEETTLGEVVEFIDGDRGKNYPNGDDLKTTGFCVFLNAKNLPNRIFDFSETVFISEEKDLILRKGKLKRGDYVMTTRGTIGNFAYYNDKVLYSNMRINSGMVIIRAYKDLINEKFLGLFFSSNIFKYYLSGFTSGSAVPQLPIKDIKQLPILLPPLPEQKAIAAVLSSFDDKIELLRSENQTLEQMGQELFKEWFGKWKVGDDLPEGWRVGKLGEMIDFLNGFAYKSSDFVESGKYKLVTIANVQDGNFIVNTKDSLDSIPEKMPDYCLLNTGDILLSLTGNVGRVCLVIGENYFLNQRVAKIRSKNSFDYGFSYFYFRQKHMITLLESISVGTAQQNLSPIKTANLDILIPSREVLDSFGEKANILVRKIVKNLEQIQSLSATRDQLLPKLMSGEVRVKF